MDYEEQKNKKHIEKVYLEKAINILKICIGILIFDGLTYLIPILLYKNFDFGLIFEAVSFVFIILALNKLVSKDFIVGKRNIVIAMLSVGWLIVYDFINLIVNIKEVLFQISIYYISGDSYFYYLLPCLVDVTLIAIVALLNMARSSINRADGTEKATTYVDTFYDEL